MLFGDDCFLGAGRRSVCRCSGCFFRSTSRSLAAFMRLLIRYIVNILLFQRAEIAAISPFLLQITSMFRILHKA